MKNAILAFCAFNLLDVYKNMGLKIGTAAILNTCTEYHVKFDWTKSAVLGKSLCELTTVEQACRLCVVAC